MKTKIKLAFHLLGHILFNRKSVVVETLEYYAVLRCHPSSTLRARRALEIINNETK